MSSQQLPGNSAHFACPISAGLSSFALLSLLAADVDQVTKSTWCPAKIGVWVYFNEARMRRLLYASAEGADLHIERCTNRNTQLINWLSPAFVNSRICFIAPPNKPRPL